jgi:hypothetical protein
MEFSNNDHLKNSESVNKSDSNSDIKVKIYKQYTMMLYYRTENGNHSKSVYQYMNCKHKLLHCSANVHFNKTCLEKQLIPKYAEIKIKKQ